MMSVIYEHVNQESYVVTMLKLHKNVFDINAY